MRLRIFLLLVATIILPCNSTPDDTDDFNQISASFALQNADSKIKSEKHNRDLEVKTSPATLPPYLAQFLQQGNNLFFKPQILLGSTLNNSPYISHESDIKEEKEKHENGIGGSVNSTPVENDKIVKDNDKITKDDDKITKDNHKITKDEDKTNQTDSVIEKTEEKVIEKFSEIPEAPILAPLNMPALPQIIVEKPEEIIVEVPESVIIEEPANIIVEEPENVIIEEIPEPEVYIEKEHNIVIPEAPPLMPLNPPNVPLQILIPKPVSPCIGYQVAIPCFPNYVQPQYPGIVGFENVSKNKDLIWPSVRPLPRIPLGVAFKRPVKTVMPFQEDLISATRYLPSVTVSKFPLRRRNSKLLKNRRRLSQMFLGKIPLKQQKAEVYEEPISSFSAYCAHIIALQRVLPNIVENGDTVNAVPLLELPERPVY